MRHSPQLLVVDLAGVPCGISCHDPALLAQLALRYAGFASAHPPQLMVEVEVGPTAAQVPDDGAPYARVGGDRRCITVDGVDFHGAFDEELQRGRIVQPADPAPLEALLTAVHAARLLREGGCLLHAAAVVRDGAAHVFYGPSGSGKTTVAGLVGEGVISDEIAVLRRAGPGWTVSGMPWRGTPLTAPLGALFRLRQASATAFRPLAPLDAVRSLLGCAFFARPEGGGEIQAFLDAAAVMVSQVPVWEMSFRPDRDFWAALPTAVAA